jgi:hypothetical protein
METGLNAIKRPRATTLSVSNNTGIAGSIPAIPHLKTLTVVVKHLRQAAFAVKQLCTKQPFEYCARNSMT